MNNSIRILIVDDEPNMRRILSASLKQEGYSTYLAGNGIEALEILSQTAVHVVITDLKMPQLDGMQLLSEINARFPDIPVIVITAHGTIENAVEAMKRGAFEYILKPFEMDELRLIVSKACTTYKLNQTEFHAQGVFSDGKIIAASQEIKKVLDIINRIADSPTTILITGESGTGKELIAQLIHNKSTREEKPFIKINCAAVPETLLESEFFGYEKGAFTGAVNSKPGRFELADGGTLFLDEIGEISREIQVKLLRVIQEREFERVGGLKTIRVDVRLIVATNIDLEKAVQEGRFRQDLFYRLNVVPIYIPPLRSRPEDIPPLVHHFIRHFNKRLNRSIQSISHEAMQILLHYSWPGNIRELENILERAILLSSESVLTANSFNSVVDGIELDDKVNSSPLSLKEIMQRETEKIERKLLKSALEESGGNVTQAAKILGLSRKGLQLKMKKFGLQSGLSEYRV
ncbi:sigma-54-dependent Fis family transcriptional regulator [bacterium]|nr:sigma-54-dependent Fis family transcriptional regulator [candidate division CSSED10-310 bacterium]